MLGLSTTAIGHRPLPAAIDIFNTLQTPMKLDYLELAVGTKNEIDFQYPDVPLVLHDSCLYSNGKRLYINLLDPSTWGAYKQFIDQHQVLEVHLHAPAKDMITKAQLEARLNHLEGYLQTPVRLEIMPNPMFHASSIESIPDYPLVLDISHLNIWAAGYSNTVQQLVDRLLPSSPTIHLSHNDGYCDSHDLIPPEVWFVSLIQKWQETKLVTYESLPSCYRRYERLDRTRKRYLKSSLSSSRGSACPNIPR